MPAFILSWSCCSNYYWTSVSPSMLLARLLRLSLKKGYKHQTAEPYVSASHTRWSIKSDTADATSGVLQGTVFEPLLFLCFINDLPALVLSSDTKLFVDHSLLFNVTENNDDRELLQRDLSALEFLEETWQMRFDPTKFIVLKICNKKKPTRQIISFMATPLKR